MENKTFDMNNIEGVKNFCKIIMNLLIISDRGGQIVRKNNKVDAKGNFIEKGIFTPNNLYKQLKSFYDNGLYDEIILFYKRERKAKRLLTSIYG